MSWAIASRGLDGDLVNVASVGVFGSHILKESLSLAAFDALDNRVVSFSRSAVGFEGVKEIEWEDENLIQELSSSQVVMSIAVLRIESEYVYEYRCRT